LAFTKNAYQFLNQTTYPTFASPATIFTPMTSANYAIGCYLEVTSPTGTAGDFGLIFTDETGQQDFTLIGNNASNGNSASNVIYIRALASTPVAYYAAGTQTATEYNIYFTALGLP
jgi:hypothetical protein